MHLEALQGSFSSEPDVHLGYTRYFGGHVEFWYQDDPQFQH